MTRARRYFTAPLALTLLGVALSGCVTTVADPDTGRYARPIGDAPVISNETPYSRALVCLAGYNLDRPVPRVAVGQIADYTGKEEADGSGRKITQGAALMAISALNKAGVRLVERFDTSVAELELKYANNRLIGDNADPYRKILAGSIPGSDYYLVGGITELNFNIRSEGGEADYSGTSAKSVKANISAKAYVMNVGLDLRLVDTRTLEVVHVISYQKQIIGREISAGVFDILGNNIINVGGGDSALEPIQLAVRSVVERAVLEMVSRLYQASPETCIGGPQNDPLRDPRADAAPARFVAPLRSAAPPVTPASTDVLPAPALKPTIVQAEPAPVLPSLITVTPKVQIQAAPAPQAHVEPAPAAKAVQAAPAVAPKTAAAPAAQPAPVTPAAPVAKTAQDIPTLATPAVQRTAQSATPSQPSKIAQASKETPNDQIRASSYRWYRAFDDAQPSSLRGGVQ